MQLRDHLPSLLIPALLCTAVAIYWSVQSYGDARLLPGIFLGLSCVLNLLSIFATPANWRPWLGSMLVAFSVIGVYGSLQAWWFAPLFPWAVFCVALILSALATLTGRWRVVSTLLGSAIILAGPIKLQMSDLSDTCTGHCVTGQEVADILTAIAVMCAMSWSAGAILSPFRKRTEEN